MYWKYFWFIVCVLKLFINQVNTSDSELKTEKIQKPCNGDFILIATVDGIVTALDINSGEKCWSSLVDPEGFLSSTLSDIEIYDKDERVVLVPSLDGGIYKYNIKSKLIQPIAGSVDSIISSSVYLDPSVDIIGGKMKIIFGIHRLSGEVIYSCKTNGCNIFNMPFPENIIVIENQIQWVKTIDLLKAEEKWNFRVVELKLKLPSQSFNKGTFLSTEYALVPANFNDEEYANLDGYKVSLPNAFVGKINGSEEKFLWLYKTTHPITDVWYLKDRVLKNVDPFEKDSDFISLDMNDGKHLALLFLGVYQNQMFIKKSKFYMNTVNIALLSENVYQNHFPVCPMTEDIVLTNGSLEKNSLTPTHMNFSVDHGAYFYINISSFANSSGHIIAENETHCLSNFTVYLPPESFIDKALRYLLLLLVLGICLFAISGQLLYDIMTALEYFSRKRNASVLPSQQLIQLIGTVNDAEFKSRFHQEFELSSILGEGGFGIVMDAKNKIDDCHYAIKRICLDEKLLNSSKYERVLREVKALAKLEHHGIVRYFNAWVEYPPAGWQEKKDIELNMHGITEKSDFSEEEIKSKSPKKKSSLSNHISKSFIKKRRAQNPFKLEDDIFFMDKLSEFKSDHFSDYSVSMSTSRQSRNNFSNEDNSFSNGDDGIVFEKYKCSKFKFKSYQKKASPSKHIFKSFIKERRAQNPFKFNEDIFFTDKLNELKSDHFSDYSNSMSASRQSKNKGNSSSDGSDSVVFENPNENITLDPIEKTDCSKEIIKSKSKSSENKASSSKQVFKSFIKERRSQNPFKHADDIFFNDNLSKIKSDYSSDYSNSMSTSRQSEKNLSDEDNLSSDDDGSIVFENSNENGIFHPNAKIISEADVTFSKENLVDFDDNILFENSNENVIFDPNAKIISEADVTFSKENLVDFDDNIVFDDSEQGIVIETDDENFHDEKEGRWHNENESVRTRAIETVDTEDYVPKKFSISKSSAENVYAEKQDCEDESARTSKRKRGLTEEEGRELSNPGQSSVDTKNTLGYLYIQMQLCKRESLRDWLDDNPIHRKYDTVLKMFFDIVDAVQYVHDCGLMHRDLKPSNIFFSMDGAIKIGDFGLATSSEIEKHISICQELSTHTSDIGTAIYMSPEQKLKEDYNYKTDIFSLGIILFELLVPFQTYAERYKALFQVRTLKFPEGFKSTFKAESILLQQLLDNNPKNRPTAQEIKEHPLLKQYV